MSPWPLKRVFSDPRCRYVQAHQDRGAEEWEDAGMAEALVRMAREADAADGHPWLSPGIGAVQGHDLGLVLTFVDGRPGARRRAGSWC